VGPFQCNCQILVCPKTNQAAVIDPGEEPEKILKEIDQIEKELGASIEIEALFHTHAHLDHISGTRKVKEALSQKQGDAVPQIFLHQEDQMLYQNLKMQAQMFGFEVDEPLPLDQFFENDQELKIGQMKFSIYHTPGHSPGGVCLRLHEDSGLKASETLFSGDTLFQNSIGRTDLWGGDLDLLLKSIRQRVFILDDDTKVCPGHGPDTIVGVEKKDNPFLK